MNLISAVVAFFVYASFIVGIWIVFRKTHSDAPMLVVLKLGALVSAGAYVFTIFNSEPAFDRNLAGVFLYAASFGLFIWSSIWTRTTKLTLAFSSDKPLFVLKYGPWKYVRHPFYTAYLLSYIAGTVTSGEIWTLSFFLGMTLVYFLAAQAEEQKFANSDLQEEWLAWKNKTGMFLPNLRSLFFTTDHE